MPGRFCRIVALIVLAALLVLPDLAAACPTCKDNLAPDGQLTGMARGYAYSIIFMLSMPPLIFGSLSAYFYWEVRKARAKAQAEAAATQRLAVE